MTVEDLSRFLTPHLASTMPVLAQATPYLLGLGILGVASAVVVAIRVQRFAVRLSRDDEHQLRKREVLIVLRKSEHRLKRVQIGILILGGLALAVWLSLWTTRDVAELTELVFIVLGIGVVAPIYIAAKVLCSAFGTAAELLGGAPDHG